jgi:hypothetical protein
MKGYFNTKEVATLIGRTPGAVRNLVLRRRIPYRKPGGRLMFLRYEIEAWIEGAPGIKLVDLKKEN